MPTAESDKNLFYMLVGLVMGAILALSFYFPISRLDLFKSSDFLCVMSLLATYSTSVIAFSFFISTFIEDAKNASIIGPVIFLLSLLSRFVFPNTNENEFIRPKLLASVHSVCVRCR